MRALWWSFNVGVRTFRALLPSLFPPDDDFARSHLPDREYALYIAMEIPDRDHAVRVTKALLARSPEADGILVRVALLHDVGKAGAPFRLWQRIVAHLHSPSLPPEPRLGGVAGAQQRHRHHPRYGAELIRAAGGCEAVARLVERHHLPDDDPGVALLRAIDDAT